MTTPYNGELNILVNCLTAAFGDEIGSAVSDKFDQIFALEATDVNALSAQIAQLNLLLASNTEGDVLTAQSILTQLAALDSSIDSLEANTGVADLSIIVTALQEALASEITSRADADAALQSNINSIQSALDALTLQVVSIVNEGTGGGAPACDCVALTSAIADQATAIANLQSVDAATAVQIAALQKAVAGLATTGASIAAAQAAADAAQATAQTALAAAAVAKAAADAAALVATGAQTTASEALTAANSASTSIDTLLIEIKGIDCAAHVSTLRQNMRARMFAVGNPHRN